MFDTKPEDAHVAVLAEANIRIDRQRHEEDQSRVQQDQAGLSDVSVICERRAEMFRLVASCYENLITYRTG